MKLPAALVAGIVLCGSIVFAQKVLRSIPDRWAAALAANPGGAERNALPAHPLLLRRRDVLTKAHPPAPTS